MLEIIMSAAAIVLLVVEAAAVTFLVCAWIKAKKEGAEDESHS